MELAIHLTNFKYQAAPRAWRRMWQPRTGGRRGGCSALTLMDHWFQMEQFARQRTDARGLHDLGFLAAHTERITLGLL